MPFSMSQSIQAVVIGDNVYVGGGYSTTGSKEATMMVYSLHIESWRTLPPYEIWRFGMAAVNKQLVLVGGCNNTSNGMATNVLGVWDEESQIWTHPLPEMPTSRYSPSAISYHNWLIVAGGKDKRGSRSKKVELLDTLSGQWYEGSPLPNVCSGMSSAINGNMWYLSRGYSSWGATNKHVFSVCLDELISQAVSWSAHATASLSIPSLWHTLIDLPLTRSALLVLNGALLAVGGYETSAIHHYQPSSRSWIKVGELLTARWECACTILPSGEILVAGGCNGSSIFNFGTNTMDMGIMI